MFSDAGSTPAASTIIQLITRFSGIFLREGGFCFYPYIQGVCILHSHSLQPSFLYEMVNEGYLEAMGTRRFVQHAFFQSHFRLDIH
jgi:hypothetical protein